MMPKAQWTAERLELAAIFDRPLDGRQRLEQLQADQERLVRRLQHGYETGVDVLYDGEKIVGRRPSAQLVPRSARDLVAATHAMLPKLSLSALIIDVDRDTAFMDELSHAGGQPARSPTRRGQLFAALVACATGIGYTRMAEASKFTERQLREAAERHLTIEHIAAADARVCEAIRGLAQTSTIDLDPISSSDGQRYPIIGRSAWPASPPARQATAAGSDGLDQRAVRALRQALSDADLWSKPLSDAGERGVAAQTFQPRRPPSARIR